MKGDPDTALKYYRDSAKINKEIGDKKEERKPNRAQKYKSKDQNVLAA